MNSMILALRDKSTTIRKAYAGAIGAVAKFSSEKTMKRVADKLIEYYNHPEVKKKIRTLLKSV